VSKVRALIELHRKDAELRESEERFRAAFEHAPIGIALLDRHGKWLDANRALSEMIGRSREELIEGPPFDLKRLGGPDGGDELEELLAGTRRAFSVERRLFTSAGTTMWTSINVSLVRDRYDEPLHLICQVQDITEIKHAEESLTARIAFLAYHDELTGLPNRAMLHEHLDLALARAERNETAIAVLCLDLNRFKLINDSLGHAAGDELLRQAATRLAGAVRASDLVARVGGDEFVVLLADVDATDPRGVAELVAAGIHEALSTPFAVGSAEFYVGTSVGIALHPHAVPGGELRFPGADALLRNADAAMYEAKQSGVPTVVYSRRTAEPGDRLELITRLRRAAQQEDFALHWMPIVDLDATRVCGVEGLIRWHDRERGWVLPHEFVTLAEETGLIDRIGLWAVEEAARCQADWRDNGLDLDVAVNLSARQLWRPNAVEEILSVIGDAGALPERLILELTESARPRGADATDQALAALRNAGIRVAIDDFAHSPLTVLTHLQVDILKIDGEVVRTADTRDGATMINALIHLARDLGIWPMAESIETREQYEMLRAAGCRFGQGHFFAHPLETAAIPEFVRRFRLWTAFDPWVAWEASRINA